MGRINKNDIINEVSDIAYLSKKDARAAVEATFDIIAKGIKNGDTIDVTNFGAFIPVDKSSRVGTDPVTHEKIIIKPKRSISLRLSNKLKEELK